MNTRIFPYGLICMAIFLVLGPPMPVEAGSTTGLPAIERIAPEDARAKVRAGESLLVCSYKDEKCRDVMLEGAILHSELKNRLPGLSKDQEIIFYCG